MFVYIISCITGSPVVPAGYYGPYEKIWVDDQCSSISTNLGQSVADCAARCNSDTTCTAVNYSDRDGGCMLMECPLPVTPPLWVFPGLVGYSKTPLSSE